MLCIFTNHDVQGQEVGIYKILDNRTKIDYSQLFLNLFLEEQNNSSELEHFKLVNHSSQATIAFKIVIKSFPNCIKAKCDQIILTSYLGGRKDDEKQLRLPCLPSATNETTFSLEKPISLGTVECLYQTVRDYLVVRYDLNTFAERRQNKTSDLLNELTNLKPKIKKIYPKELLPGNYKNTIALNSLDSSTSGNKYILSKEKYSSVDSKRLLKLIDKQAGNAALLNHIYYDEAQASHEFLKYKEIKNEINEFIDLFISPVHNKPGTVINYMFSGEDYLRKGAIAGAINQYSAAITKLQATKASAKYKLEFKRILFNKLSAATDSISMENYSKLLSLSADLLNYKIDNSEFSGHFYNTSDELSNVCEVFEEQIRKKKNISMKGVVGAAATVGSGIFIASMTDLSEDGLNMASDFVTSGVEILTTNFDISNQISDELFETSSSIEVSNNIEIDGTDLVNSTHFLSSFIEAYSSSQERSEVMDIVNQYFSDNTALVRLIKRLDPLMDLNNEKNVQILKDLGNLEVLLYNYEVRNLKLPAKFGL